jgi:hypothetical protein
LRAGWKDTELSPANAASASENSPFDFELCSANLISQVKNEGQQL